MNSVDKIKHNQCHVEWIGDFCGNNLFVDNSFEGFRIEISDKFPVGAVINLGKDE